MKRLFLMECRKITRSVLYWLYLAALVVTVMQNYETTVENELGQTDNPLPYFISRKMVCMQKIPIHWGKIQGTG